MHPLGRYRCLNLNLNNPAFFWRAVKVVCLGAILSPYLHGRGHARDNRAWLVGLRHPEQGDVLAQLRGHLVQLLKKRGGRNGRAKKKIGIDVVF